MSDSARPRLFIGSSSESEEVATTLQEVIGKAALTTPWRCVFELSGMTLESLENALSEYDFAVFVFAADDVTIKHKESYLTTRDNVVYELGLFTGRIGRHRTFIIKPESVDLHLPTDLLGLTIGMYEDNREDGKLSAALAPVAVKIKRRMKELGPIVRPLSAMEGSIGSSSESSENEHWYEPLQGWRVVGDTLEIAAPGITPVAYYLWNRQPLACPATIEFNAVFLPNPDVPYSPDLRLNLLARRPDETYTKGHHLQVLLPWEGGRFKVNVVQNSEVPYNQDAEISASIRLNEQIHYRIEINESLLIVHKDGNGLLATDLTQPELNQLVKALGNKYWGFATPGGHVQITRLTINGELACRF